MCRVRAEDMNKLELKNTISVSNLYLLDPDKIINIGQKLKCEFRDNRSQKKTKEE